MTRKKKATEDMGANENLQSFLKQRKDEHYNFCEEVYYRISTGSLLLDIYTGGGLMPGLHRFVGMNEGGKTSEALEVMRNFLNTIPDARGVYFQAEGRLTPDMKARTGIKLTYNAEDWKDGTCFVFDSNIYESVFDLIKMLITDNKDNKKYLFLIDSMDALILRADMAKDLSEAAKVSGGATISSTFMKKVALAMTKFGHTLILISQVRESIVIDPYAKRPIRQTSASGGNALLHYANFIFEFEARFQKDLILEKPDQRPDIKTNQILGHYAKVTIKKSPNEKTNLSIAYPVKYGRKDGKSIWREYEVLDILLENGMLEKKGAWIKVSESVQKEMKKEGIECPEQFQGRQRVFEFLEENTKFTDLWFDRFRDAYSGV
jgi:recombination protein RecA